MGDRKDSTFRPRQAHHKSRQGCIRCKKQRKKCDEGKPRCSRCMIRDHVCQYTELKTTPIISPRSTGASKYGEELIFFEDTSLGALDSAVSNHDSSGFATPASNHGDLEASPLGDLNATELALLSHYIDHTSHVIPLDAEDYYVLHTGIPNLAFTSRPLMASLLALAAVCKCNDLVCGHEDVTQNIEDIRSLLLFADERHRDSLKSIQTTICNTNRHDHVLANAVLMVLYANANQSTRVALAEKARYELHQLPNELHPQGCQWVTIIRAAHVAFVGLLNNNHTPRLNLSLPPEASLRCPTPSSEKERQFISQDGPTLETRSLFMPIVTATYASALDKLRTRVKSLLSKSSGSSVSCSVQTCLDAMGALETVVQDLYLAEQRTTTTPDANIDHSIPNLSEVPDWLSSYVSRVTSVSTPTASRRIVMSFLNRVPLTYIHSISSVLERVTSTAQQGQMPTYSRNESEEYLPAECEKMAADIFAHWLCFVMFLDGIWWIRDIGIWELERLVTFMRHEDWLDSSIRSGEWWPENMLLIKKNIAASIP